MSYFLSKQKRDIASKVGEIIDVDPADIVIEKPNQKFDADLAIPLFKFASSDNNPNQLATLVSEKLHLKSAEKVEAAAGFVNIWLDSKTVGNQIMGDLNNTDYGNSGTFNGQKTVVEFTDPNPFKELHIGHAYSNSVGESLSRLLESAGSEVTRVTYGGDVGLHVAKAIWGIQKTLAETGQLLDDVGEKDRANFLGQAYVHGATVFEDDEQAKQEITELNGVIYDESDDEVNQIRQTGTEWSYAYFDEMYSRLKMSFDRHIKESETVTEGMALVERGLSEDVFEKSDGAVVFRGEKHDLHTRVLVNQNGFPTYETKELGLMKLKDDSFHFDHSIVITGNDQSEYLKVMLKAAELLMPELATKTTTLSHGVVRLSTGKMSSRTGDVVTARQLLDDLESQLQTSNPDSPANAQVALGAFKYAVLKNSVGGDIVYDLEESLDLQGNSGPYVQYAAVRVGSILEKLGESSSDFSDYDWASEKILLMHLARYPEAVQTALDQYQPHHLCTFIYDLSRDLNRYYENVSVKDASENEKSARLALLAGIKQVFEHCLGLLNIPVPEKM